MTKVRGDPMEQPAHRPAGVETGAGLPLFDVEARVAADPALRATAAEQKRLRAQTAKVLDLLLDGRRHDIEELRKVGGPEGEQRLRDLRDRRFGALQIESIRVRGDVGRWVYRLNSITVRQIILAGMALKVGPDRIRARVRGTAVVP